MYAAAKFCIFDVIRAAADTEKKILNEEKIGSL